MKRKQDKISIIQVPFFDKKKFPTTKKSSYTKSRASAKNTKPELILRKALWAGGYRYRLHNKTLPGKPDIVFSRNKLAIFIDGDFWHGYNWIERKSKLKTNIEYWVPKIERNMQRDIEITQRLESQGWTVIRLWEHEVVKDLDSCINRIADRLLNKGIDLTNIIPA